MKAIIEEKTPEFEVDLIQGSGGVFEVMREGELLFSKKRSKRFPEPAEILELLGHGEEKGSQ